MKKILLSIGGLILLVIAVLLIAPFFISLEDYKPEIAAKAKEATGRDLKIGGKISLSLFPTVAVEVNDVALANYDQGQSKDMVTLEQMALELQVMPLLSSEVVIDRFVLVKPVINLEVDKNGKPNWELEGTQDPASDTAAAESSESSEGGSSASLSGLSLGDVRIQDGELHFTDLSSGTKEDIEALNLEISLDALNEPLSLDGRLDWKAETINLKADIANLESLMNGASTALEASVSSSPVNFSFNGTAQQASAFALAGALDLDVPSVKGLTDWVGAPIERQNEETFGQLSVKGQLDLNGPVVAFDDVSLAFDALTAQGALKIDSSGAVPNIVAALSTGVLDITPYLPPETAATDDASTGNTSGEAATAQSASADQGWDDTPIDFSGLKSVNTDLALKSEGVQIRKITIGVSELGILLQGGKLTADLKQLALYDGQARGKVVLDSSKATPTTAINFDLSGVQAEPLLSDSADFEKLLGTLSSKANLTTQGASQKAMVSNLNGTGDFIFQDGAVKGVNIPGLIRNVSLDALQNSFDEAQSTDFAELSGTYTIQQGVVNNQDLSMIAPLFRLSGKGTVPMPPKTLNYRLEPKLVGDLEGQGGDSGAKGLAVPLMITGSWSNPKVAPDLAGALTDQLKDPSALIEGVTSGEGGVKLPLGDGDAAGGVDEVIEKPKDALKKLFGN
ncbi:AsmA family protein [uncultured Kiloniella sp.]|uniref:AsmA family protein n=1 Tax=uncultured Kiloniella sp. TaxID=1133091 RepID=UPI002629CFDD|nr:AsmA family protein [uncultured Kiloniella sp.]